MVSDKWRTAAIVLLIVGTVQWIINLNSGSKQPQIDYCAKKMPDGPWNDYTDFRCRR